MKLPEDVAQQLEAHGYRLTPARRAVLAAVLSRSDHFTVDDVCRQVRRAGRATVFRTMKLLVDLGVVCRVLLEDGSLHYRLARGGHHHHLVCVRCGQVQDFTDCSVADWVRELAGRSGFTVEGHWLELYGRCQSCQEQQREGVAPLA